ncbi:HEPN-associated N-terminal domain-containing protein [Streptomyces sp. NBC_01669]|uniref:HEPN-associated N-terminal domain-containing protein n=1 Tax=Streptomyces sp. NBC_01669 TaxID=2975909 RepID=UPI00225B05AB|nr:HEPN-associated N-terminal domain-containing protein [Streptomyces sp. NBC_01669]MCX4539016.1 HEPN-associated N-terminal domain-containing protein [Streptomyces sp. NBC_01669]
MIEDQDDQGWYFTDQHVCTGCVDDDVLVAVLSAAEDADTVCSFCERSPAAELDVLLETFVAAVYNEYGSADDEGVSYDGREGGYQWTILDTWEVVEECGGSDVLVGEGLFDAVCGAIIDKPWVPADFIAPRRDEALRDGWARFCEQVQYRTRYVFWLREMEEEYLGHGEVSASRILDHVGDLVDRLGLVKELPAGTPLWRALTHEEPQVDWNARRLGTAPRQYARQANRMSPAGIPMFYGAIDAETAVQETSLRSEEPWATAAAFETSSPCSVVDFTDLPPVPSLFDRGRAKDRRPLMFLRDFAAQLTAPARSTYEQIDYVPTQVVTEYLLHVFRPEAPVSGLLYTSSLTGKMAAVIDVPNERCIDHGMEVLGQGDSHLALVLDSASRGTVPVRRDP